MTIADVEKERAGTLLASTETVVCRAPIGRVQVPGFSVIHTRSTEIGQRNDNYSYRWNNNRRGILETLRTDHELEPMRRWELVRAMNDSGGDAVQYERPPSLGWRDGGQTGELVVEVKTAYPQRNGV